MRVQTHQDISQELKRFRAKSDGFILDSEAIFERLEKLPEDIASLQGVMARQSHKQEEFMTNANAEFQAVSSHSQTVVRQANTILGVTKSLGDRVSQSIDTLLKIGMDVRKILSRLKQFSKNFSHKIAANGYVLVFLRKVSNYSLIYLNTELSITTCC